MTYHPPTPIAASAEADASQTPDTAARPQGWTAARQAEFLRQLAASHCVAAAARAVGMSRQSAYRLRARLKGTPFDQAWRAALRSQYDALAQVALERALHGVEVPHFYKGELVHISRRYDERLTLALLTRRGLFDPASAAEPNRNDLEALAQRVEAGGDEAAD